MCWSHLWWHFAFFISECVRHDHDVIIWPSVYMWDLLGLSCNYMQGRKVTKYIYSTITVRCFTSVCFYSTTLLHYTDLTDEITSYFTKYSIPLNITELLLLLMLDFYAGSTMDYFHIKVLMLLQKYRIFHHWSTRRCEKDLKTFIKTWNSVSCSMCKHSKE